MSTLKKAQYKQRGSNPTEFIEVVSEPIPSLQQGQVLVEVLAAPINPSDVLTLTGEYGQLPPLPAIGGNEGVGKVTDVADGVSAPTVGQIVLLPVGSGTWCTHMVLNADQLIPLPDTDPKQLAMMTINPPTAALLLSEFVDLQSGDWVIQNAANSAVGGYLISLAKKRGVKTINIVRRESSADALNALGADIVLVDGPDLVERVKQACPDSIKLGIDAVGGDATSRLSMCLAAGATLVNYGMMSGEPCRISPAALIFNDVTLRGFWLAHWFKNATQEQQTGLFGQITQMIANGQLQANIAATYSIDQIKEAVQAAATGERDGKIVLTP